MKSRLGKGKETYTGVRTIVHGVDCVGAKSQEENVEEEVIELHDSRCSLLCAGYINGG